MHFRPPGGFIEELLVTKDGHRLSYEEAIGRYGNLSVQRALMHSEVRRRRNLPKLSGYPPNVFISHRWDAAMSMSRATILAVELGRLGFNVFMDQMQPTGFGKLGLEVPKFVAQVVSSHYFVAVRTPAYESSASRTWIYEEKRLALLEAADLRLRLVNVVQDGDTSSTNYLGDIFVDARNALPDEQGNTMDLRRRLIAAGLVYGGPRLDQEDQAKLKRTILKAEQLCNAGDHADALKILSQCKADFSWTQEWKLHLAKSLAGLGQINKAAELVLELADLRSGSSAETVVEACFILEEIGLRSEALKYWTPFLRVFHTPARSRMRKYSSVYRGVHGVVGNLLEDLGETEGAFNHFRFLLRRESELTPSAAADLYNHLGHIRLFSENNPKSALGLFERATALDPAGPAALNLIICLCRLGRYKDAEKSAKDAVQQGATESLLSRALLMISSGTTGQVDHTSVTLYGAPKRPAEEGGHLRCDKCAAAYPCADDSASAVCVACGAFRGSFMEHCPFCSYDGFVLCSYDTSGFLCPICADGLLIRSSPLKSREKLGKSLSYLGLGKSSLTAM